MAQVPGIGSRRICVVGTTGSGKSEFQRRHIFAKEPRLLVVDNTGEWKRKLPDAEGPYMGLSALYDGLRRAAGRSRWQVIAVLDNEELEALTTDALLPQDIGRGFAAQVGGMGLALGEVDLIVPGSLAPASLRGLWRRGRHARLSIYADTQAPSSISKEVTRLCEWLVVFRLYEENDVEYLKRRLRSMWEWAEPHIYNAPFGSLLFDTQKWTGYLLDKDGRIVGKKGQNAGPGLQIAGR